MQNLLCLFAVLSFTANIGGSSSHSSLPMLQTDPTKLTFAAGSEETTKPLFVMAATAPASDMGMNKSTTTAMDKGTAKSQTKRGHASGEVTALDSSAKTFTIKTKSGDTTFKWDDKTVVTPKGKTPAVGDRVTVTFAKDSDIAQKIAIHKAKASKKDGGDGSGGGCRCTDGTYSPSCCPS